MYPYIIIFFITSFLALTSFKGKKVSWNIFFLYCMAVGTFVGIGDMLGGYDRYIYCEVFTTASESLARGDGFLNSVFMNFFAKEPLYGAVNSLIGLITPNRYVFILLYTWLVYAVYAHGFYKYTEYPFFSFFIFMGLMFFFTFTYLRQVLAAGIVWMALPYYTHRKTWKYMAMIGVAAMTHNSAAIMAVLYFVPLKKWKFSSIIPFMLVLLGLGLIGVGEMFAVVGGLTGVENISSHADAAEVGFRIEYVIESLLFLVILYMNYQRVEHKRETLSYLNLYLMFCGILLFFCKSGDGGRIAWYGIMGIIIMLTRWCRNAAGVPLRAFLSVMFFVLYMRILFAWQFNMCPYKTFFTPGHTAAEWIYEMYEYDQNYDLDKFYNL